MLQQARARKRDGYDIIVGVVETHGRKETQALLEGFEVVPRKRLFSRCPELRKPAICRTISCGSWSNSISRRARSASWASRG